jgi:hypothetical protein
MSGDLHGPFCDATMIEGDNVIACGQLKQTCNGKHLWMRCIGKVNDLNTHPEAYKMKTTQQILDVPNMATEYCFKNAIGHLEALQTNLEKRNLQSDADEIQNLVSKLYSMRRAFWATQEVREKNGRLF